MNNPEISIIIRTLNEAVHLPSLLSSIKSQKCKFSHEVVLIDSGSTDNTLEIAKKFHCRITHIKKKDFSFGRSLNRGIDFSNGKYLVFISGHCVPQNEKWLENLVIPIADQKAQLTYGRQLAGKDSFWSERQIYKKYFPDECKIPQTGFFCNNANSALLFDSWKKYLFDEQLTGLEDMELAQRLTKDGGKVAYVSTAAVYHLHNESWYQVQRRFEREAIALRKIFPGLVIRRRDVVRYIYSAIINDIFTRENKRPRLNQIPSIFFYRVNQYIGSYRGNNHKKVLTAELRENYFYPSVNRNDVSKLK